MGGRDGSYTITHQAVLPATISHHSVPSLRAVLTDKANEARRADTTRSGSKHHDQDGISLRVARSGLKTCREDYRWQGIRQIFTIGTYPEVRLVDRAERRCSSMTSRRRASSLARKQAVPARSGSSRKPNPFARWLRPGSPTPPCWSPRYTREMREKLDKVVLPDVGKVAIGALGRAEIEGCLLAPIVARGANRRDAARTWCAGFLSTRWTWSRALGVRHHLSVPHRQAVVQAKHPHVHIAVALLRAEVGGLLIGEGEVSHLHDNEAGRAHRPLSPVHIGLAWLQMLTQFGRVGEEDAQGGGVGHAAGPILAELA